MVVLFLRAYVVFCLTENIPAKSRISSYTNFPSTKNIHDHDQLDTLEPRIKIKH